ncbi:globin domain-containing protein [Shewanella sp.]|uniref:globin domain-containing protein n=1 Tax=Shewanella sp. TaxID=50422 RepID=UPI0035657BBC
MDLSPHENLLIQQSFAELDSHGEGFAHYFFDLLFQMAPLVKPMFKSERNLVEHHFYEVFSTAVIKINQTDELEPTLLKLGARHTTYGVKEEHFKIVRTALLLSIEFILANRCNEHILSAWGKYFDYLASVMCRGMAGT